MSFFDRFRKPHEHMPDRWVGDRYDFLDEEDRHVSIWACRCGETWERSEGFGDVFSQRLLAGKP